MSLCGAQRCIENYGTVGTRDGTSRRVRRGWEGERRKNRKGKGEVRDCLTSQRLTLLTTSKHLFPSQAQRLQAFAEEARMEQSETRIEDLMRESNESSHLAMQ